MTTHEYLNKESLDILNPRESILNDYYAKLKNGAKIEQNRKDSYDG